MKAEDDREQEKSLAAIRNHLSQDPSLKNMSRTSANIGYRSWRVALVVVLLVFLIDIVFAVALLFLFIVFIVGLLSTEDGGRHRIVRWV
jgi:hypothetical protein